LAQPLISDDCDWFTPADLTRVINAIHALPDWSFDADFLGTRTEAEVIARELGSKAQIPTIDDQTPNAAAIDFTGASGKKLHIES